MRMPCGILHSETLAENPDGNERWCVLKLKLVEPLPLFDLQPAKLLLT